MSDFVHLVRHIPAAPQRVYEAWLDAKALTHFMRAGPEVITQNVEVDATLGGHFSLEMVVGSSVVPIRGEYIALEPWSRLAFRWYSSRAGENSVVTLTFAPDGEGTLMTLTHEGFADEEARSDHEKGWGYILGQLSAL